MTQDFVNPDQAATRREMEAAIAKEAGGTWLFVAVALTVMMIGQCGRDAQVCEATLALSRTAQDSAAVYKALSHCSPP